MDYLLDSNIILIYSRDDQVTANIEKKYKIFSDDNRLVVSVVTVGEIEANILKLGLGVKRRRTIEGLLDKINQFGINLKEVVKKYAEIDAFSQGKLRKVNFSARNMGKNDIWIAATASAFKLPLVTTDKDFHHLEGEFIELIYIPLAEMQ